MKNDSKEKVGNSQFGQQDFLLDERSVYIEGVRVLQKQEKISYFSSLIIALVLVILLFVILMIV